MTKDIGTYTTKRTREESCVVADVYAPEKVQSGVYNWAVS